MSAVAGQSLSFKVRKVARYVSLYGPRRTWAKVRNEYHLTRTAGFDGAEWRNSACRSPGHADRFVALVGCGGFAYSNIAYYLRKAAPRFLRVAYDIESARARSLCTDYGGAYAAGDFGQVLADPAVRLLYIASNHASHAEYAIRALDAGKHVHIEKPHVISADQLRRLGAAQERNPYGKVFLGFNRPHSSLFRRATRALAQEQGPLMINWFIAGHSLPEGHWYFSEAEGGRVLGNMCHWTDLTLHMVGRANLFPCRISAVSDPNTGSDFVAAMVFADRSVAAITFSAKGHTFEGVREVLNAHRGSVLVALNDFQRLRIDAGPNRRIFRRPFRDHGHEVNIANSYRAVRDDDSSRVVSREDSEATAWLFLAVKEAVLRGRPLILQAGGCIVEC